MEIVVVMIFGTMAVYLLVSLGAIRRSIRARRYQNMVHGVQPCTTAVEVPGAQPLWTQSPRPQDHGSWAYRVITPQVQLLLYYRTMNGFNLRLTSLHETRFVLQDGAREDMGRSS